MAELSPAQQWDVDRTYARTLLRLQALMSPDAWRSFPDRGLGLAVPAVVERLGPALEAAAREPAPGPGELDKEATVCCVLDVLEHTDQLLVLGTPASEQVLAAGLTSAEDLGVLVSELYGDSSWQVPPVPQAMLRRVCHGLTGSAAMPAVRVFRTSPHIPALEQAGFTVTFWE